MRKHEPTTVDEYIEDFPPEIRERLQGIRAAIREALPRAGERISYRIPAMTLDGRIVIYFAGWERHVSVYPVPDGDEEFQQQIAPYRASKGTLRFPVDTAMPYPLIGRIASLLASRRRRS